MVDRLELEPGPRVEVDVRRRQRDERKGEGVHDAGDDVEQGERRVGGEDEERADQRAGGERDAPLRGRRAIRRGSSGP